MDVETDVGLKSRMRENRTYGSVRGRAIIRKDNRPYLLDVRQFGAFNIDRCNSYSGKV
jgi:hypothetical protein